MAKYKHSSHTKPQSRDAGSSRKRAGRKADDLFADLDDSVDFDSYSSQLSRIE